VVVFALVACGSNGKDTEAEKPDTNTSEPEKDTEKTEGPQQGGELVIGYEADVSNLDPILSSVGSDHPVLWPLYDTLIAFTNDLEPAPGLAESWEQPDSETLILHLRDDVVFHDGTKMDAEAVKFSLERVNSEE